MSRAAAAITLSAVLLAGCIFLPRTSAVYDSDCEIYEKRMTLEVYQVGTLAGCSNEGCVALLVAAGVVSTASAVVSGSVVVAGNAVYWLEAKGQCMNLKRKTEQP